MTLSELKRLAARFSVAAEKIAFDNWDDDYKGVRKMLRSLGWNHTTAGKWTPVIRVVGRDLILKRRSGLSDGELPSEEHIAWMLKHVIPTADFHLPDGNAWTVQPVALRTPALKYKAYNHFTKTCTDKERLRTYDIHLGNVGWYKGKPVLIDW